MMALMMILPGIVWGIVSGLLLESQPASARTAAVCSTVWLAAAGLATHLK